MLISQAAMLCASLVMHEGVVHKIYEDHLGNKTVGIGHLVTPEDPEYKKPVGSVVSSDRIIELFARDCEKAYMGANRTVDYFHDIPEEVQNILVEMAFQLGVSGLLNFRNMRAAIADGDWNRAADEMLESRWARQTPERAIALAARMRSV